MEYQNVLEEIGTAYRKILGENLVGLYVHGSIAFGCFRWDKSDIDFLAVTREEPSLTQKEEMVGTLLALDREGRCPPKGFEMSAILERDCRDFAYPTPYTLHYSNEYQRQCQEDLSGFCQRMHGTDRDLAAHFTVVRAVGITLWGEPIETLFGPVPKEAYLDSIQGDIKNAREDILRDPVYCILNLCRVLAYQQEGQVLSKKDGGLWGLKVLPDRYCPVVEAALSSYGDGTPFRLEPESLRAFADGLLERIFPVRRKNPEKDVKITRNLDFEPFL